MSFGSKADMRVAKCRVRFTPESDIKCDTWKALGQKRTWTAAAFRLAAESVKRVVRTHLHIKTGWCSAWRVAHLWMAAASNGYAADDGASNLWLCSSGSLRVTFVVPRRRAGRHQRECKHNGRDNGYDCFHGDPSCNR